MKREFLTGLGLEKDVIDQIMKENGKDIEQAKSELTTVKEERDSLKNDLSERDKQIETLRKSVGDNDELKKQIETLQADNHKSKVNAAVELALVSAKAKNNKAVIALLTDLDKAEFNDDGTVKGLSKQIEKLKSSDDTKFLFASDEPTKLSGLTPADPGDKKPQGITKEQFNRLGYLDRLKLKQNDPETYNTLTGKTEE